MRLDLAKNLECTDLYLLVNYRNNIKQTTFLLIIKHLNDAVTGNHGLGNEGVALSYACLAQLVEHLPRKQKAKGSSPLTGFIFQISIICRL